MKKFFISLVFIGLSGLYVFSRTPSSAAAVTLPTQKQIPVPTPSPSPNPTPIPVPTPTPLPPKTGFKDGTFTGSVADAYYGLVQVKAIIVNGKITDVVFLSYPNHAENSRYINSQAMPMLTQEAIQVQSANVNTISGATATSQAFQESLAVALASAKY